MTMLKNHNDDDDNRASHNNGNNRDRGKNRVNGDNHKNFCHTFVFFLGSPSLSMVSSIFVSVRCCFFRHTYVRRSILLNPIIKVGE